MLSASPDPCAAGTASRFAWHVGSERRPAELVFQRAENRQASHEFERFRRDPVGGKRAANVASLVVPGAIAAFVWSSSSRHAFTCGESAQRSAITSRDRVAAAKRFGLDVAADAVPDGNRDRGRKWWPSKSSLLQTETSAHCDVDIPAIGCPRRTETHQRNRRRAGIIGDEFENQDLVDFRARGHRDKRDIAAGLINPIVRGVLGRSCLRCERQSVADKTKAGHAGCIFVDAGFGRQRQPCFDRVVRPGDRPVGQAQCASIEIYAPSRATVAHRAGAGEVAKPIENRINRFRMRRRATKTSSIDAPRVQSRVH